MDQQQWVKNKIKKFQLELSKINQYHCPKCNEMWPTSNNVCQTCKYDKDGKFTRENNMIPLLDELNQLDPNIQNDLEQMTQIEEMLISPIAPMMSVHRLPNGQLLNNGYCATFAQDLKPILTQLPRLPEDVDILVIQKKNKDNTNKQFICDKNRLIRIIKFMEKHNQLWIKHGCKLNYDNLKSLPQYGIPNGLPIIIDDNDEIANNKDIGPEILENENQEEQDEELDEDEQCYIEIDKDELQQINKVKATINIPITESLPINEYELSGILTLAFPKLFPLGKADPTNKIRLNFVSETEAYRHLIKYACKNSKGIIYYPFTNHPRFLFYVADRLRRHRTLSQSKVYLKQNNNDAALTIQELKEIIDKNESKLEGIIKRMSAYSANITGSDAFWYRRKIELQATFEQKKTATAFCTFSYADMHLADLHRLMPGNPSKNKSERYQKCLQNPHIVDWYFSHRLTKFMEVVFDDILECEWRWHRYEWQKRTAIHAHGCIKLKNDPDLIKLTSIVYLGKISMQQFPLTQNKMKEGQEKILIQNIINGNKAESIVISYVDTLVTAMNPSDYTLMEKKVPEPHPCCIDINLLDINEYDQDYIDLVNCCQRHMCRIPGYCVKSAKKPLDCRFGYPFEIQEDTTIQFSETLTRVLAEIKLKRNDPWMNAHNRLITQHWRGNTDLQAILDAKSAKDYIAKYATKCN